MKKVLEGLGSFLVIWGAIGLAHHVVGWFRFWGVLRHLPFVGGREVYASLAMLVLGAVLLLLSERLAWRPRGPEISEGPEASVIAGADRARKE